MKLKYNGMKLASFLPDPKVFRRNALIFKFLFMMVELATQRASIENCQCPLDLLASSFTCHIALLKASGKNTPQTNFHERLMKTSSRSYLSLLHEVYCHLFSWSWRKRYLLSGSPIFESEF